MLIPTVDFIVNLISLKLFLEKPILAKYFSLSSKFRDLLSSLTSMIVKSGHGSLLSEIVSTSTFQQEGLIKKWICDLENVQVRWSNVIMTVHLLYCPLLESSIFKLQVHVWLRYPNFPLLLYFLLDFFVNLTNV